MDMDKTANKTNRQAYFLPLEVSKLIRNVLIGVLAIGLAGTAYWGYTERQEKNAILIHAENNYQRAFNDLAYEMDVLNDKIGTTLAMNSRTSLSPENHEYGPWQCWTAAANINAI